MQKNATTGQAVTRVLLADTGALLCQQVTAMLSGPDCELIVAADGFEVLCRLPELRPDVLLLAADLPRLNGIQVCTLLRQSPDFSTLPILMLISAHSVVEQVRAQLAGADACIEKPFRSADLQAAFTALLEHRGNSSHPVFCHQQTECTDSGLSVHR